MTHTKNRTRNTWTFRIIQHELHAKYGYISHGASIWVPVPGFPGPFEAASPQRLPGRLVAFMAPHELLRSMAWGLHPLQVGSRFRVLRVSPGLGLGNGNYQSAPQNPTCFRGVYGKWPGFWSGQNLDFLVLGDLGGLMVVIKMEFCGTINDRK